MRRAARRARAVRCGCRARGVRGAHENVALQHERRVQRQGHAAEVGRRERQALHGEHVPQLLDGPAKDSEREHRGQRASGEEEAELRANATA